MRKLTFLIVLAAIVFGVWSPSFGQVGGLMFPGPGMSHTSGGSVTLDVNAGAHQSVVGTSGGGSGHDAGSRHFARIRPDVRRSWARSPTF
jgi:hypothetical protein